MFKPKIFEKKEEEKRGREEEEEEKEEGFKISVLLWGLEPMF